jgi:hypothetical protein
MRSSEEENFNAYTEADGREWHGRVLNKDEVAANVDKWCKMTEAEFANDTCAYTGDYSFGGCEPGMYQGLGTIKHRTR